MEIEEYNSLMKRRLELRNSLLLHQALSQMLFIGLIHFIASTQGWLKETIWRLKSLKIAVMVLVSY